MVRFTMASTAEKLRHTRRTKNMTQAELAKSSGVPAGTIANIEADHHRRPYPSTLKKLADALEVHPSDLIED